jgi:hypothetical protein
MVPVMLVTLLVKNVTELDGTNVILAQKVNISMMLMLVFLNVQTELGKMMTKMNVIHVTNPVKLVTVQMTTNVMNVSMKLILKITIVSSHHVLLVTILKLLTGLVLLVTPLVVNVLVQPRTNVLLVAQLKLPPIYMKTPVLLHAQMVIMLMMDTVLNVTTNVVLVPEVLKTLVSPVVITYSGGTTNVPKNVQKDGIKTY